MTDRFADLEPWMIAMEAVDFTRRWEVLVRIIGLEGLAFDGTNDAHWQAADLAFEQMPNVFGLAHDDDMAGFRDRLNAVHELLDP